MEEVDPASPWDRQRRNGFRCEVSDNSAHEKMLQNNVARSGACLSSDAQVIILMLVEAFLGGGGVLGPPAVVFATKK